MSKETIIVHIECPDGHLPHSVNFFRDIQQIGVMQKNKAARHLQIEAADIIELLS